MSLTYSPPLRHTVGKGRLLVVVAVSLLVACNRGPSAEEYFQRAAKYSRVGNFSATVVELKNALRQAPEMGKARGLLGQTYVSLGFGAPAEKEITRSIDLGSAVSVSLFEALRLQRKYREMFERAMASESDIGGANVAAYQGVALAGLGHYAQASRSYHRALELEPDNLVARHGLTRLMLFLGRFDEAQKQIYFSLKANPDDIDAYLLSAQMWSRRGEYGHAVTAYSRALELCEAWSADLTRNKRRAHLGLARLMLAEKNPQAAERHLKPVMARFPQSVTVNHLLGVAAMERGDIEGAKKFAQIALSVAPNDPNALQLLGSLESRSGNLNQAEELTRRLVANNPDYVSGRKLLASVRIKLNNPRGAIQVLRPIADRGVRDATVYTLLGSAYYLQKDYAQATAQFQKAANLKPPHEETIQSNLALSYLAAGSPDKAIPILEAASSLSSSFVGADYLLAMTYLSRGKPTKAREWARRLIKKQPKNPVAYDVIGRSYWEERNIAKARSSYLKALDVDPNYVPAAMNLAQLTLQQNQPEKARAFYQQVLDKHPRNSEALLALARLSQLSAKPAETVKLLTQARDVDTSALEPRLALASDYMKMGRWKEAFEAAKEAYRLAPNDPRAIMALGASQLAGNRTEEALANFRALEKIQPNSLWPYYYIGLAKANLGDIAAAQAALAHALRLKPDHLPANMALGRLDIRTGNPELAIPIAERLIKRFPKTSAGYVLRGEARLAQKDAKRAATDFARAFEFTPNSPLAQRLFQARRAAGDPIGAEREFQVWLKDHPKDTDAYLMLAYAATEDGRNKAAISAYERAISISPNNAVALNNLADLYGRQHDPRALATAKRAFELRPDLPDVLDTYGWILAQSDSTEKGLKLLRQAAAKKPGSPAVRYHLAAALAKVGNTKEAKRELQALLELGTDFPEKLQASTLLQQLQLLP